MTLDARGPVGDRRFMIVDPQGRFVTQREAPTLALIRPRLLPGGVSLEAQGRAPLTVMGGERREKVSLWRSELEAIDVGDEAAAWLSSVAQRPLRLVAMAEDVVRPIDAPWDQGPTSVAFADGFPLLVTHQASVDELNERLEVPVTMDRFRPNIVIEGGAPWDEDHWSRLTIGSMVIDLVKPCERCKVINVDPQSGEASKEPLRSMASYRRVFNGSVVFGQNAVHGGPGVIRVGDPVVTS